jgi:excinuclease ABC subunit A
MSRKPIGSLKVMGASANDLTNLDVIKCADWILDLGPEGGPEGGRIVAQGTPEQVARVRGSHTSRYLRDLLPTRSTRRKTTTRRRRKA